MSSRSPSCRPPTAHRRIGTLFFNPGGPGSSGAAASGDPPPGRGPEPPLRHRRLRPARGRRQPTGDRLRLRPRPRRARGGSPAPSRPSSTRSSPRPTGWPPVAAPHARGAARPRLHRRCRARSRPPPPGRGRRELSYLGLLLRHRARRRLRHAVPGRTRVLALDGGVDPREYAREPLAFSRAFARGNEAALAVLRLLRRRSASRSAAPPARRLRRAARAPGRRADPGRARRPTPRRRLVAGIATLTAMFAPDSGAYSPTGSRAPRRATARSCRASPTGSPAAGPTGLHQRAAEAGGVIRANDSRSPAAAARSSATSTRAGAGAPLRRRVSSTPSAAPFRLGEDSYRGRSEPGERRARARVGSTHDNAAPTEGPGHDPRAGQRPPAHPRRRWTHRLRRSACIARHVNAYLIDRTLPPAGTQCPTP